MKVIDDDDSGRESDFLKDYFLIWIFHRIAVPIAGKACCPAALRASPARFFCDNGDLNLHRSRDGDILL